MTTTEAVHDVLVAANGEEMSQKQIYEAVRYQVNGTPAVVSAITASLIKSKAHGGVVRTGKGVYAYRPDQVPVTAGPAPKNAPVQPKVIAYLEERGPGSFKVADIAKELGKPSKSISQVLSHMMKNGNTDIERVKLGIYDYHPNGGFSRPASNDIFAPVLEAIPDYAFDEVGMKVVGRTKDGDRLAIDQKGTAWAVNISVTARLV